MAKAAQLDFTNVKDGSNFNKRHQPEGEYKGRILKVDDVTKKDDKSVKMWLWTIKVGGGTYPYYTTHTGEGAENQLWKIRNLFIAAGVNVPKKRQAVDPNKIVNKDIGVSLADEEYNDKMQSVISATFPVSELEADVDADDDDDEEEDEESSDDDEEEEEEEEETPPPAKKKKKTKKAPEPEPEDDDEDDEDEEDEDEDEEEEEPEPPKKKSKKSKKSKKVDDNDLEELDIEDL